MIKRLYQSHTESVFTEFRQWFEPLSEPTRVKPRLSAGTQQFLAYAKAAPFPETVTESRWHQPWSEPVRRAIFGTQLQSAAAFTAVVASVPVPVMDWGTSFSNPPKAKITFGHLRAISFFPFFIPPPLSWFQGFAEVPKVKTPFAHMRNKVFFPTFPPIFPESHHHQGWRDPIQITSKWTTADNSVDFVAAVIIVPTVDGWVTQLATPSVLAKPGLKPALQSFIAYSESARFSEIVSEDRWHQPWSEPVRTRWFAAAQQMVLSETINPVLITPFIGLGWYLPLSNNGRKVPPYSALLPLDGTFDPIPIPNPPQTQALFTVSGGDVRDKFPVPGVVYPYAPETRRTV